MCENEKSERKVPECNCVRECRERAKAARMRPCVSKLGARETARMRPCERVQRANAARMRLCERVQRANAARIPPWARMQSASESCQNATVCKQAGSAQNCQNATV